MNVATLKNMESCVRQIASQRYHAALFGLGITICVFAGAGLVDSESLPAIAVLGGVFLIFITPIILINAINAKKIHNHYRAFNKIFYIYFASFQAFTRGASSISNASRAANPFQEFASGRSNASFGVDAVVDAATVYNELQNLKTAEQVEYYFSHLHNIANLQK